MRKILCLIIIQFPGILCAQQEDSIPTDSLIQSIRNHYLEIENAINTKYIESKKGDWVKWVPSVGIGYTPNGSPRPTASYSLANILNIRKAKQEKEQLRLSELQMNQIECEKQVIELRKMVRQFKLKQKDYEVSKAIFEIDLELFEVQEKKYNNNEISPREFLKMKQTYLKKEYELGKKKEELQFLKIETYAFAHVSLS